MKKVVFTIARQYGSGGKTVGKMLADELGIPFYNEEILQMASDESGIRIELFNQADEKLRNNPLFASQTRIYKGGLITPDKGDFVSPDNLFNYQAKVILELDGAQHCTPEAITYDQQRSNYLAQQGLDVIRISNRDVMTQFRNVCEHIDTAVQNRILGK